MTIRFLLPALALAAAAGPAAPVAAQGTQCGERARVVQHLLERYGETRRAVGLAANNVVVEVYASADTGTWTITATLPNGLTCLIAAGQGYEPVETAAPARGTPA